ncbi:Cro/Cl family transcriptional regulator [Salmonella enterica]|nr:Cro/Cl family transcriptional regulator [Salmonella enterica]
MKKIMFASVLVLTAVSGSAMATAITTGQLTFNWQGVIPTAPVTSTAWAFVDARDMPFVPGTEQLNISKTSTGIKAVSGKAYDFFIVPVTAGKVEVGSPVKRDSTKALNSVKAFLGSNPVSGGLIGNKQLALASSSTVSDGHIAVNLNGSPLAVGSEHATTIGTSTDHQEHIVIDMNASIATADVSDGASLSFVAPVVFSVDI